MPEIYRYFSGMKKKDTSMLWVGITTFVLLIVTLLASLNFHFSWVFFATVLGQGLLILMVLRVLQSPYRTDKTFEDFYEDHPIRAREDVLFRKD